MSELTNLVVTDAITVDVTETADFATTRQSAERLAAEIGFETDDRADLGDVAAELAANLHKHAGGGTLYIKRLSADSRMGIRLEAHPTAPEIQDIEATFTTESATTDSLGIGLSTVNQIMDELTVTTPEGTDTGTRLVTDRWLTPEHRATNPIPASIGAASRGISSDLPNGDAFVFKTWNDTTLVGVIDGLGHGPQAHEASTTARDYVESHAEQALDSIFRGTDRACNGTRGVVMALAKFDWTEETLTFANVGNINVTVAGPEWTGFVVRRGVIGGNFPEPAVVTREWRPSYTMILYSDGVSTRWEWDGIRGNAEDSAGAIANRLLKQYGKSDDDATALVVTDSNSPHH